MDDAIKRALEVAGEAMLTERENMGALAHRVTAPGAKLEDRLAAAAIAAFLEAVPQWAMLQGHDMPPIPGRFGIGTPSDIAAAVRRAAG